jgi:hypothetical protein
MKKIITLLCLAAIICFSSCSNQPKEITPKQAKAIAEEAYIFAFPMIDHYKMMFATAMYKESGAYEAPFNVLFNNAKLNGPQDTIIVRPNNDTFYSGVFLDLSKQPQILSVPAITDGRYYSFQIIDMYTHNIDYVGTRKTGFDAGNYMFVGPYWDGETPKGITKVIKAEGNYLLALGRTQVFSLKDFETAQAVMAQYSIVSYNKFMGKAEAEVMSTPPAIPPYNPVNVKNENFISYLNALMTQGKIHPTEKELFTKFAKIGIVPGEAFNSDAYAPEIIKAINEGIASASEKIIAESAKLGERKNGWQLVSGAFGTREAMQGKYLTRAAAAYFGLYGNDLEEAFYPETTFDADNEVIDGSKHNYVLHFDADELPPVNAFWSISMYKLPEQLFMENEINRYIISSNTEGLKYNADGSLDIYIQKENPGKDKESNWLPANNGELSLQTRMYWPKPESLEPLYVLPQVEKNN